METRVCGKYEQKNIQDERQKEIKSISDYLSKITEKIEAIKEILKNLD